MNWIKNFSIFVFVLIISLKVADVLIATFHMDSNFGIENRGEERKINLKELNPNLVAKVTPPANLITSDKSILDKQYDLNLDSDGFIATGNNFSDSTKTSIDIVFLGGSTTEQLFIPEKSRWQSILERALNNAEQKHLYKVFNGGVSGNHSLHSNLNLVAKVLPMRPDYVVLMHNINDLALLRLTGSYWVSPEKKSLILYEKNRSFYLLARDIKDLLIPNIYELIKKISPLRDDYADYRNKPIYDYHVIEKLFKSSLVSFISICRAWDIEPILMTQFNRINMENDLFVEKFYDKEIANFVLNYHNFNETIKTIAADYNVDVIDLAALVPSTKYYIYDDIHLNEAGSKLVADILIEYFSQR